MSPAAVRSELDGLLHDDTRRFTAKAEKVSRWAKPAVPTARSTSREDEPATRGAGTHTRTRTRTHTHVHTHTCTHTYTHTHTHTHKHKYAQGPAAPGLVEGPKRATVQIAHKPSPQCRMLEIPRQRGRDRVLIVCAAAVGSKSRAGRWRPFRRGTSTAPAWVPIKPPPLPPLCALRNSDTHKRIAYTQTNIVTKTDTHTDTHTHTHTQGMIKPRRPEARGRKRVRKVHTHTHTHTHTRICTHIYTHTHTNTHTHTDTHTHTHTYIHAHTHTHTHTRTHTHTHRHAPASE
jgi:hypothetical protein